MPSYWIDIPAFHSASRSHERTGYPTQKPLALLERIILSSSDEEHIILDPFCGSGTTIDAAIGLRRDWIGIDKTEQSIETIQNRLKRKYQLMPDIDYSMQEVNSERE